MLIAFVIFTYIHLYASLKQDKPLRNKSKPFIILSLMGFYCYSVEIIEPFVILALLFSLIGDLLLIPKGIKWFASGGVSFLIGHLFFIFTYLKYIDFNLINKYIIVVLPLLFITSSLIIFKYLKPHLPELIFYPMLIYLIVNGLMNCFAWFRSLCLLNFAGLISAIGAFLFYISDTSLFFVRFKKDCILKTHFLVMLTYSLGELLIILGLILS